MGPDLVSPDLVSPDLVRPEPEEERAARRDHRTVEIMRAIVLATITVVGVAVVLSVSGRWTSDVLVSLIGLAAAGTLLLAVRRVVRLRRDGL